MCTLQYSALLPSTHEGAPRDMDMCGWPREELRAVAYSVTRQDSQIGKSTGWLSMSEVVISNPDRIKQMTCKIYTYRYLAWRSTLRG